MIYLDTAAATPMLPEVTKAMQPYYADYFYNPSATYLLAKQVRTALETARTDVAHWLGAKPGEIIFTAGGTEADNLAVTGVLSQFPGANIVVSSIEHDAVLAPASEFEVRSVAVDADGQVKPEAVVDLIDANTVLVSVMYVNNEVGTIEPIHQIAEALKTIRATRRSSGNELPLYFHTDACQAANYLDLHVNRLGVDMMTLNGSKIYGPKQSGGLYVASSVKLQPIIRGGGQERNLRSGTENVAAAIGFATALNCAQTARHAEAARLHIIQAIGFGLIAQKLPHAIINGSLKQRLPNNIHLTLPGQDNERLLVELETMGIIAAAGSACSASSDEPSHVLRAMGITDNDAQASLRFTMGRMTGEADIRVTIDRLAELCQNS